MNEKAPWFLPLRAKLAISFTLLAIIAIGLTTFTYYQNLRARIRQDIRERLRDAAAIGALQIDGQKHSQLTDPSQEGNETYRELKRTLQGIRDAGINIRFAYTMRQDEQGNIIFVVDAEETEQDISHLGDIYDDAGPLLTANFATMQGPLVEEDFYTDKWGTWLTGYAPFYTPDGRREGILGMDISASNVIAQEKQALGQILVLFLLALFPIVAVGWWLGNTLSTPILKLTEGARKFASGDLAHRIQVNTHDEIETLTSAFNTTADRLSQLVTGLEQRVAERTADLKQKSGALRAAASVARQIVELQDLGVLLDNVVQLIVEQFGFYHAGIFLLNDNRQYAVLQAASSEGGKRMLSRGHRLKVGTEGIVGYVAERAQPRVTLDVGTDAVFFNNPDLPLTRSEMALPLIVRGKTIGVLDIQSIQSQAFDQDDVEIMQTLADQIAIAIDNTRLLGESRAIIAQFEKVTSLRTREAWREFLKRRWPSYQYTPTGIRVLSTDDKDKMPAEPESAPTRRLHVPLELHGQQIGVITLQRKPNESAWTKREAELAREIAEQVALALENSRLIDETNRRAAKEQLIGEISAKIGTSINIRNVLQTAVEELGRALPGSEVMIQLANGGSPETKE